MHIDVSGQIEFVDADALVLIGGVPTSGRADWVHRDDAGFVLTGPGRPGRQWSRHVVEAQPRPRCLSKTSGWNGTSCRRRPTRLYQAGGVNRREGAMAVQQVHHFLMGNKALV